MVFAYLRVSSKSQEFFRQREMVNEYAAAKGITIDRVFEEKQSGKDFQSREIYQSLKTSTLRPGDTLIVTELDRLGRNMEQIKNEYHDLVKIGVAIIVLENDLLSTADKSDLEKNLISNIVFSLLSYVAEKERQKIRSRTEAGIKRAQAEGKFKGRKPRPVGTVKFENVYKRWRGGELTAIQARALMEMKKDRFYDIVAVYEGRKKRNRDSVSQKSSIELAENNVFK